MQWQLMRKGFLHKTDNQTRTQHDHIHIVLATDPLTYISMRDPPRILSGPTQRMQAGNREVWETLKRNAKHCWTQTAHPRVF